MDITFELEKITNYLETAKQIIWSDDELKIFILKNELEKMLKIFLKESKIELFNSYLTQVYYFILLNQVYSTINKNSIILLKKEIEYLKFIIKAFSKVNIEEIYQLIIMFENLILIDLKRIQYIHDNANSERTIINDLSLQNIDNLLLTNDELQKNLSMKKTP